MSNALWVEVDGDEAVQRAEEVLDSAATLTPHWPFAQMHGYAAGDGKARQAARREIARASRRLGVDAVWLAFGDGALLYGLWQRGVCVRFLRFERGCWLEREGAEQPWEAFTFRRPPLDVEVAAGRIRGYHGLSG